MAQRHKIPFVLASSAHGPVILNAIDWRPLSTTHVEFGVGTDILIHGEFDLPLISMTLGMLESRRQQHGPGVIALDCGANIGIYTLEWARTMEGWGTVIAFEPQERIYYALAGNIALNNLFNAKAFNKAVGAVHAVADMPMPDYCLPGQFGGLALNGSANIGQKIEHSSPIEVVPIDALGLKRVDFIKLDIEGMEVAALQGARKTIAAHKPFLLVEWHIAGLGPIEAFMAEMGYETAKLGMNLLCGPAGSDVIHRLRALPAMAEQSA